MSLRPSFNDFTASAHSLFVEVGWGIDVLDPIIRLKLVQNGTNPPSDIP